MQLQALRRYRACIPAWALLLSGCSSLSSSINPIEWWHDLQGGAIAEQRPPPPGATDPFPNLATVPEKPAAGDPASRQSIAKALVGDRTNAQYEAAQSPLPDPSSPAASPGLVGGTAPPPKAAAPNPDIATASLEAANAPPPPPTPRGRPVPSAPNPAPAQTADNPLVSAPPGAGTGSQTAPLAPLAAIDPAGSAPTDPASMPPLPDAPPPPPTIAGLDIPANPAPTPRLVAPPPPPPKPAPLAAPIALAFSRGSAALPIAGQVSLRQWAAGRGRATIAVTGYGESRSNDPQAQSAAVGLGLGRAQAIAATLSAAGVPASSMRISAEAAGRGGAARLVD